MRFRISPLWWPVLLLTSPALLPWLLFRSRKFREGQKRADRLNNERIASAEPLDLSVLKWMEITPVVEYAHEEEFLSDSGVSYLIRTDRGVLLMDLGFGPDGSVFSHNTSRLGLTGADVDALFITHLHLDHMGGLDAAKSRRVTVPAGFYNGQRKLCFVPDECSADHFEVRRLSGPSVVEAGLASTGPLARMLFFSGYTEEQAIVAHLENKGLVIITGCGHPTIEVIIRMVRKLSPEPIYAIGGGLHFPITKSRSIKKGIQRQQIFGTGKAVWERITDDDLSDTIAVLNGADPKRLLLSAHDTCDHALRRLSTEVDAEVEVLRAGATYKL